MRLTAVFGCILLSASFVPLPADAAVVTVDVTIKAVNIQARGITVVYKTELGEKSIELDVSRKAEITVNEKPGTLSSLGSGQKAKLTYERDLGVVTKIEANGLPALAQEVTPPEKTTPSVPDDKRLPIPATGEQQTVMDSAREMYGEEFKAAKSADQKRLLADKVLAKARESASDPTTQYVLLRLARDTGLAAGDIDFAMRIVDELATKYQHDAYQMKLDMLTGFHATSPKQRATVAGYTFRLVPEAVSHDDFEHAKKFCQTVQQLAKQVRDRDLGQRGGACLKEVNEIATAYEEVQPAVVKLRDDSNDPGANAAVGRYQCLLKGEWQKGLPLLARGNDSETKSLAQAEVDGIFGKEVALGDRWWKLSESLTGRAADMTQLHAADLYRKVLDQLTGLEKDRIQKRLAGMKVGPMLAPENAAQTVAVVSTLPPGVIAATTFEPKSFYRQGNRVLVGDMSGNGAVATISEVSPGPGKVGTGLVFPKCNPARRAKVEWAGDFPSGGKPRSACMWVKCEELPKGPHWAFIWGVFSGPGTVMGMNLVGGTPGYSSIRDVNVGGLGMVDREWHHHAITYDGKTYIYYLDTKPLCTKDLALNTLKASPFFGGDASLFEGVLDEVVIFHRAISPEEVKVIYDLGVNGQNLVRQGR